MENIPYKQTGRTSRSQLITNNFSGGMFFSNQPTQDGYCRCLVNLDVTTSGTGLNSRPGLVRTEEHNLKVLTQDEYDSLNLKNMRYISEISVRDTELRFHDAYLFMENNTVLSDTEGRCTLTWFIKDIDNTYLLKDATNIICSVPKTKSIFNCAYTSESQNLQPVSCQAWNNAYYCFRDNGETTQLCYLEKDKIKEIKPKVPSADEIEMIGYNALRNDMYSIVPKSPIIVRAQRTGTVSTIIDYSDTSCYTVDVVDSVTLKHVDALALEPEKLYYIVTNYNLGSWAIDGIKDNCRNWSSIETDGDRTTTYALCKIGQTDYVKAAGAGTVPIQDKINELVAHSDRYGTQVAMSWNPSRSTYRFQTGDNRKNEDDENIWGYQDSTVEAYAPGLLYFPIKVKEGETATYHIVFKEESYRTCTTHDEIYENTITGAQQIAVAAKTAGNSEDTPQTRYNGYTLTSGKTMSFWKNRLWIGNVVEDQTMLFWSQTDMPEYFPYPSNTHVFNEPIIKLITMQDLLIVFTKSKLYTISTTDNINFSIKCIQQNLYISSADAHLILTVKNMLFFKSGNYYYMVVPKANSLTNELTIAPISKNITNFLDNFQENVYNLLDKVYNGYINIHNKEYLVLQQYYNFLDYEDIVNVFKFNYNEDYQVYMSLIYNSVKRYWRVYTFLFDSDAANTSSLCIQNVRNDATQRSKYILLNKAYTTELEPYLSLNILDWATDLRKDVAFDCDNPSYFDTGYLNVMPTVRKRFREFQFELHSIHKSYNRYYTNLFVDSEYRKDSILATPVITDGFPEATIKTPHYMNAGFHPEYDIESFYREFVFPTVVPVHYYSFEDLQNTGLNNKLKLPISGKGYLPRVTMQMTGSTPFTIHNTALVYRTLNAR